MYRSILLLALCLPLIALALPSFHVGVPPSPSGDQHVEQVIYDCSTQCTNDRKAAEVLLNQPDFPSPQSLQSYCDNLQCMDQCARPKNPYVWYKLNTTKIMCTDEDYAKSYECLEKNAESATTSPQCKALGIVESEESVTVDSCKAAVEHFNCVVDRIAEICGEPARRASKRLVEEDLQAAGGCKKPE